MGAAKPKTIETTTNNTTVSKPYVDPLSDKNMDWANASALQLYKAGGQKAYTGNMTGSQSDAADQAMHGIMDMANSGDASLLGNTGLNYANGMIQGGGLSDEMRAQLQPMIDTANGEGLKTVNPYLQKQIDAMNAQISDRVNGAMSANGRYGSGAHTGVLGNQLGTADASILSTNFENNLNRQMQAGTSLADIYGQGLNRAGNLALNGGQITDQLYSPYERMAGVGQYYEDWSQKRAEGDIARYNMNAGLPWQNISNLMSIGQGYPTGTSQNATQTSPTTRPSALQSAVGLGATAAGTIGKLLSF